MATKSTKNPPRELTEADRLRIAEAREVLEFYGLDPHPESVNSMDDVSYEQRNCRMKAMDLAVAAASSGAVNFASVQALADVFYDYIWKGEVHATV